MDYDQVGVQLQALLDRVVERETKVHNAVLGVALDDVNWVWSGASGVADPAIGASMQADRPFLIASITKMYTAAAVMILQERGQLRLDDKISNHLPSRLIQGIHRYKGTDYSDAITIRHLVGQTSGLADYFLGKPRNGESVFRRTLTEGDREWNLEDVLELARHDLSAVFPPAASIEGRRGSVKAHYSDTNYKLLGAIIESVTGSSLDKVFDDFFFAPLGLHETYLYGSRGNSGSNSPAPVFHKGKAFACDKIMRSHGPEGGIVSTVNDTLRFGRAFMHGELFASHDTLRTMQNWNRIFFPLQYGYGLMRFRIPRFLSPFQYSPELIGHSGSSGSFLYYCEELQLYMAGTINEMTLPRVPFRLMLQVADTIRRFRPSSVARRRAGRAAGRR